MSEARRAPAPHKVFPLRKLIGLCACTMFLPLARAEESGPIDLRDEPGLLDMVIAMSLGDDAQNLYTTSIEVFEMDADAAAVHRSEYARAFAQTFAALGSDNPVVAAKANARCAWLLGKLGSVYYGAAKANAALDEPAAHGEMFLARAWMCWRVANFDRAEREAALAASAPQPPPAWALAEWKTFRETHRKAADAFTAASEPEEITSAQFLDYIDLARAAGAIVTADDLVLRAESQLRQQLAAQPGTSPALLHRALAARRDDLLDALGNATVDSAGTSLWPAVLRLARAACEGTSDRAPWEIYFKFLVAIREQQSGFDASEFDIEGDLAAAEKMAGFAPSWRAKFKDAFADPRQRYASQLLQAKARLEADAGYGTLSTPVDSVLDGDSVAALAALAKLANDESTSLTSMRTGLPADAEPVKAEPRVLQAIANIRFRHAIARNDEAAARARLAELEALADSGDFLPLDDYKNAVDATERKILSSLVAEMREVILREGSVPDLLFARAGALVANADAMLRQQHSPNYLNFRDLSTDEISMVQSILYVRIEQAAARKRVLEAERIFERLEYWSARENSPPFDAIDDAREAIEFTVADDLDFTDDDRAIHAAVVAEKPERAHLDILKAETERDPDRLVPWMLMALVHWRLGEDNEARAIFSDLRKRIRVGKTALETLAAFEANNDPDLYLRRAIANIDHAGADELSARIQQGTAALDAIFNRMIRNTGVAEPTFANLPYPASRTYGFLVALTARIKFAEGDAATGLALMKSLKANHAGHAYDTVLRASRAAPFRNDLPDDATRAAWAELLEERDLDVRTLERLFATLKPHFKLSNTANLSVVIFLCRYGEFDRASEVIKELAEPGDYSDAYKAQVAAIESYLNARNLANFVITFGPVAGTARQREILQSDLRLYVDARRDSLAEAYRNDVETSETREVSAMEARIAQLTDEYNAAVESDDAKVNENERYKVRILKKLLATLREQTL